jgi:2-aminobenzoylacetyl-CoA thioesterase
MRINKPGKICDNIWFLGHEHFCVYLIEGTDSSMLINAATAHTVPVLLQQFQEFHIDESKINKLLILHSHFDHVGIAPFFLRRYRDLILYASKRCLEVLSKPRALQSMNDSNRSVAEDAGQGSIYSEYDLEWRAGTPGVAVGDGDVIDLGGIEVRIIDTPGHSPCSVAAYVPQRKALLPSDAGGVPHKEGAICTYGTSNYTVFQESLHKLEPLGVEYLCADHCGCLTGEEAKDYISTAIKLADLRRSVMADAYQRTGDARAAAAELADRFREENVGFMVSHEVFTEAFYQMIRHIAQLGR